MRSPITLLALVALVAAWAILGIVRDHQRAEHAAAHQFVLIEVFDTSPADSATTPAQRAAQDAFAGEYGVERDSVSGAYVAPPKPGPVGAVPGGWFHGVFGAVAALLSVAALGPIKP